MTKHEKVYEWNLAYRIDHWVRTVAISILIFTGYYIYWPFLSGSENGFLMAWMRFFHFAAMYAAILGLAAHIYFDKDVVCRIYFSSFYMDSERTNRYCCHKHE